MGEFVDVTSTGSFGLISVFCTAALASMRCFSLTLVTMMTEWRRWRRHATDF